MVYRRLGSRWFGCVLALVTCGALLFGCGAVFVIPTLDTDLSAEDAQRLMERKHIRIPDSFSLVRMRQFGCPVLAGGCGYEGSYVAPAERFSDSLSIFSDETRSVQSHNVTCAELKAKPNAQAWKFDCSNAIEMQVSAPYGPGWNYLVVARDLHFAEIYLYQSPH